MSKNKVALLLVLILIIAGGLRLYHIKQLPPGLYPDEAMDGTNAQEALATGQFKVFYPENNGREGLFMNIQAGLLALIKQNEPWVLRFPSAIFGILTVLGLYFLGRELFSKKIGLLAAFFLATSFWHIMFSRIGFRAIMAPFFLTWALYLFLRSLHSHEKTVHAYLFSALGGLAFGLGFYSYIAYRVTPLLFLLLIPFFIKHKKFWKLAGIFFGITFLVALPIGLYFLQNPADFMGRATQISVFSSPSPAGSLALSTIKTVGMLNFFGDWNWRQNFAGRPELFWPVGIFFWIGVIAAVSALWKKIAHGEEHGYSLPSALLLFWLIFAALPVVFSNEGIPHALRSILMLPALMLLASWGGAWLYDRLIDFARMSPNTERLHKILKVVTITLFILLFVEAYTTYFILWGKNRNISGAFNADYVEIARKINTLSDSVPKYVVVDADGVLVRGLPMPTQSVMFMTDTYLSQGQRTKNVHYVLPEDNAKIPPGGVKFYLK
jgi:4-amino-4-deoxy-L-arabinose transferase-like glycosyltransferase